ncbi:MAG: hypothetical protein AB2L20_07255 [Mangrovibacterium sp.]
MLNEGDGYRLVFRLAEKNATTFHVGTRFDSEDLVSLLFNGSFYLHAKVSSVLSLTGRLGKQYMASMRYTLRPSLMRNVNFQYAYRYHDIDFYRQGEKVCNAAYNHHAFEVSYSSAWLRNFSYRTGIAYELYHNADLLYKGDVPHYTGSLTDNMVKYFMQIDYNTQDQNLFPTRGIKFSASGSVYTDNMVQHRGHTPFYAIAGKVSGAYPLNDRITLLPSSDVRLLEGDDIPLVYRNALGGEVASRYLAQQIPFIGVDYVESARDMLLTAGMKLRYRIKEKHYVSCIGNIASDTDKLNQTGKEKILYGAGLNYTFGSLLGPIGMTAGYSNLADSFYCFVNVGCYF